MFRAKEKRMNVNQVNEKAIAVTNAKLKDLGREDYLVCAFSNRGKNELEVTLLLKDDKTETLVVEKSNLPHHSGLFSFLFHTGEMIELIDSYLGNKTKEEE